MKRKAVIFGASSGGRDVYSRISDTVDVIYAVDNDPKKWTKNDIAGGQYQFIENLPVKPPSALLSNDYDEIYIGVLSGFNFIREQLKKELRVPEHKIKESYIEKIGFGKIMFLDTFAEYVYKHGLSGNVAECGVFQGNYAREINRAFPDRKLFLFDTFEGYDTRDVDIDKLKGYSVRNAGDLDITSEQLALSNIPHPKKCVTKKGYFPETFDTFDECFCFVHLDMDLYQPMKSGIETFYPQMVSGGVILVADYFSKHKEFLGGRTAVDEFTAANPSIHPLPIGDGLGIAIVKE